MKRISRRRHYWYAQDIIYMHMLYLFHTLHLIVPFPRLRMWFKVCIISASFYLTYPASYLSVYLSISIYLPFFYSLFLFAETQCVDEKSKQPEKKKREKRKEKKNRSNLKSFVESDTGERARARAIERLLFAIRNKQNGSPLFVFSRLFAHTFILPESSVPRLSKWSPINFHIENNTKEIIRNTQFEPIRIIYICILTAYAECIDGRKCKIQCIAEYRCTT